MGPYQYPARHLWPGEQRMTNLQNTLLTGMSYDGMRTVGECPSTKLEVPKIHAIKDHFAVVTSPRPTDLTL